uniref:MFS transporter n=1 Tax=Streptomyces bottropensis TaxID=42235 RepID=W8QLC4_9ACTN|nr:hypothetical protein [Streptomyces bottropensis]
MSGGRPRRNIDRGIFRSLAVRNFRLFVTGQALSVSATWMMVVAQDWLVLSLTGDSGLALGFVTAAQFGPLLLFTLHGGKLADRYDKRRPPTIASSWVRSRATGVGCSPSTR